MTKKLLMGNEAFAHAALEAGVRVAAGSPGTPSSELIETVAKLHASGAARGVHVEWSTNEKSALELLAGASYAGARCLFTLVMAAADVVLCRAGASTISELTAIAKPSILVPSPNVTANHQEKNARVLADQGAAVLLLERDCVENTLYDAADHLLRDRRRRDDMVRALTAMAVPDAGEKIYWTLRALMK